MKVAGEKMGVYFENNAEVRKSNKRAERGICHHRSDCKGVNRLVAWD